MTTSDACRLSSFVAPDGVRLAYRRLGAGRPVVLLHGFFSTGANNWIDPGHAAALAAAGHEVIVPDLRAHGSSERPHGARFYPPDVLADDAVALVDHLALTDLDLAGYSLGARTVVRLLARGVQPRRAVVGGQGLRAITHTVERELGDFFRRVLDPDAVFEFGTREWLSRQWLTKIDGDRVALRQALETSIDTPRSEVVGITVPTLVVMGSRDDPDDGKALAAALPRGSYRVIPGDHIAAARRPELAAALVDFLA